MMGFFSNTEKQHNANRSASSGGDAANTDAASCGPSSPGPPIDCAALDVITVLHVDPIHPKSELCPVYSLMCSSDVYSHTFRRSMQVISSSRAFSTPKGSRLSPLILSNTSLCFPPLVAPTSNARTTPRSLEHLRHQFPITFLWRSLASSSPSDRDVSLSRGNLSLKQRCDTATTQHEMFVTQPFGSSTNLAHPSVVVNLQPTKAHMCPSPICTVQECSFNDLKHLPTPRIPGKFSTRSDDWGPIVRPRTSDGRNQLSQSSGSLDPHTRGFVTLVIIPTSEELRLVSTRRRLLDVSRVGQVPTRSQVQGQPWTHIKRTGATRAPMQPEPLPSRSRFHFGFSSHQTSTQHSGLNSNSHVHCRWCIHNSVLRSTMRLSVP